MYLKIADFEAEDFSLYFKNTLMRLIPPNGKAEWVYSDGWDGKHFTFRRGQKRNSEFTVDKTQIKNYKVDVKFPVGYFNTKQSAIYCQRTGMRQNSKGLILGHSMNIMPMEDILIHMGLMKMASTKVVNALVQSAKDSALSPELANAAFDSPKYPSLQDALIQVRSRKVFARALSSDIAVVPHHANKDFLMFFHEMPVAELASKTNKIKVLVEPMRGEIKSLFESQGATVLP